MGAATPVSTTAATPWKAQQSADGAALGSVWWLPTAGFKGDHYAVMPLRLAAACVLAGCPPGGTVLDPFAGTGTTGVAAKRLGRRTILIELNPLRTLSQVDNGMGSSAMFWRHGGLGSMWTFANDHIAPIMAIDAYNDASVPRQPPHDGRYTGCRVRSESMLS